MSVTRGSRLIDWLRPAIGALLLAVIAISGCAPSAEEAMASIGVSYIMSETLDFVQHLTAHVDIGANAATNYDPAYVARIRQAKAGSVEPSSDLETALEPLRALDMDLIYLQTLGIYCQSVPEMLESLRMLAGQPLEGTQMSKSAQNAVAALAKRLSLTAEKRELISSLVVAATEEYESFYRDYRVENLDYFDKQMAAFALFMGSEGLRALAPALSRGKITKVTIWLSESRRVNGLGLNHEGGVGAVVRLPEGEGGIDYSFFFAAHELTHWLSDPIVYKITGYSPTDRDTDSEGKGYSVHMAVEQSDIVADYWIFHSAGQNLLDRYMAFCRDRGMGEPLGFDLPAPLKKALQRQFSKR